MRIITGLGNPGKEYENTRHNTGRIVLSALAKKFDFDEFKEDGKTKSLNSFGKINKEKVMLLMPNNFMNNSGKSIVPFIKSKKPARPNGRSGGDLSKLIVIYDDIDLPLGKIKISFNRSSGGHNGLNSIIKAFKSQEFLRIRIGIATSTPSGKIKKPNGEKKVLDFLLGEYKLIELAELKKVSKKVCEAIETLVTEGKEKAMSLYN